MTKIKLRTGYGKIGTRLSYGRPLFGVFTKCDPFRISSNLGTDFGLALNEQGNERGLEVHVVPKVLLVGSSRPGSVIDNGTKPTMYAGTSSISPTKLGGASRGGPLFLRRIRVCPQKFQGAKASPN